MQSGSRPLILAFLAACLVGVAAGDERTITADELFDRMRGMWLGQLIGNAAGRGTEGRHSGSEADPNESVPWQIKQVWDADDDTDIEVLALHILQTYGFDCNSYEITEQWLEHLADTGVYIANKQAWGLMLEGYLPPETGSRTYNEHWYSIDAQISTELLGAVSAGLPLMAVDLAGRFGRITNDGFAVHAAQFYAATYANAFFEPNVVELVQQGLATIPAGSRTREVVSDVLTWYADDLSDGPLDWRATRRKLYDKYQGAQSSGGYYNWVESTINTGATVLALLYGQGDFKQTIQIAVLAGWDCDCNPATAGGLLGIIKGFSGLPTDLTDPNICGEIYVNTLLQGLPQPTSITDMALATQTLAEENILLNGGSVSSDGPTSIYTIPECNCATIDTNTPDPIGPSNLVGETLAADISVTAHASVERYDQSRDRNNLNSIMDGVTDNSTNGHRPYYTYLPEVANRPESDWYELAFSQPVRFTGVTFHEGDVVWNKINAFYADDEAQGGFFEDLTVQVLRNGEYVRPAGLHMSGELGRFQMYQTITFSFEPTVGQAVRIIGTPGGSRRFTTILELEPQGELYAGPRVEALVIGDGEIPLTKVSTVLVRFDESVTITTQDIELVGASAMVDLQKARLLKTVSRRAVLLVLPEPLPAATYELRLRCSAITDDFALPLIDDDNDPTDALRTTTFEVGGIDQETQ